MVPFLYIGPTLDLVGNGLRTNSLRDTEDTRKD